MTRRILFFLLLLVYGNGFTQFSFSKNYTSNDGLPSSKVYDMLQDRHGYMWFATENGVSRFDGYEFKNYTTDDGLPANSTVRLYEDYKGRIWFSSYRGPLSYYENEKIIPFDVNEGIDNMDFTEFFDNIYVDRSDVIWLSPFKRGLYSITPEKLINKEYIIGSSKGSRIYSLYYIYENEELFTWTQSKNDKFRYSEHLKQKEIRSVDFTNLSKHHYYQNHHCKIGEDDYLFSLGVNLKQVKNGEVISDKFYNNEIIAIFMDSKKNLWISENFKGLYLYPKGNILDKPIEFLYNTSVTKILQDTEGNYWFSTTEKGVYCVPSVKFTNYEKESLDIENDLILTLEAIENKLFFTTNNKGIHSIFIENNGIRKNKNFKIDGFIKSNINDLLITSGKHLWVSDSEFFMYYLDGRRVSSIPQLYFVGYNILQSIDNSIFLSHRTGYSKYENTVLKFESQEHSFNKQVFCLYETIDTTLLLGTFEGLYKYKNGIYSKYDSTCPVLNSRITDINMSKQNLWVGTFNNGIGVNNSQGCQYINKENGLISNRIKTIFHENEHNVWVGTNKGLSHILIPDIVNSTYQIVNYTIWDGLPSNEINDIIKIDSLIWLGTNKGLVSFNPRTISKSLVAPTLNLEKILINENPINRSDDSVIFNSNENNITFEYKGISYKDPGKITYYYKLVGLEDKWLETQNTSVRYPELEYGDYRFNVKAKNTNKILSEPVVYNFTIKKHYTQTVFFKIIIYLFGLGIILFVFVLILRNIKKREKLKQQVIIAEQTALRAQMNPHFIFNSLNSIQDFVLKKDNKNANLYLSNFSALMRRTLENSKNNTISLREEINTIKTYLELEKLRFEKLFKYSINIDPKLDLDEVFIPTLLLQTYIENAIWHGLAPNNANGQLTIDFVQTIDKELSISIIDNGIGRKKAKIISSKRKNHRSMGMKNAVERVQLLNKLNRSDITINIIDLYSTDKQPEGTRVEVKIKN